MKTIIQNYTIDILGCSFLFAYCKTFKEVQDYVKKNKVPKDQYKEIMKQDDGQIGIVLAEDNTDLPYLVYIRNTVKGNDLIDTLLHETNHLVYFLHKYHEFSNETEFQARLHEHIFRDLMDLIKK